MHKRLCVYFVFLFTFSLSHIAGAQDPTKQQAPLKAEEVPDKSDAKPKKDDTLKREKRKLGDIFLGFRIAGGFGYTYQGNTYQSGATHITDEDLYFYSIGMQAEFYFTSFFALVATYDIQSLRFTRTKSYQSGSGFEKSQSPYEQWFNNINISGRFLFLNMLYLQTGPSMYINYNSKFLGTFTGVPPMVNDSTGIALRWQLGIGISKAVGFTKKGEPLMTIDAGFNVYIPVAGNIIDGSDKDGGGTKVRITENPYTYEFSLAMTFLIY